MNETILIIEDEKSIADALIFSLEEEMYKTVWCDIGSVALDVINNQKIDLILLDIGLPDIHGFELCKMIKAIKDIPIIFLTARKEEVDTVIGLEIGADDYVTKPFSLRELMTRIKVLLNRYKRIYSNTIKQVETLENSPCAIDDVSKTIKCFDKTLLLTRYEYCIFKTLMESPNRVYSRSQLMDLVWDEPESSYERAVDTHIKSIRNKLKKINSDFLPIKTHHGLGYSYSSKGNQE